MASAGCGGAGSEDLGTQSLVPSRTDYLLGADAVCSRFEDQIEKAAERRFGLGPDDVRSTRSGRIAFRPDRRPSSAEIEEFATGTAIPSLRQELDEVRARTPPAGDAATVTAVFDAAERAIDELAAEPGVLADMEATRRLFLESRRLGRGYGFRVCGI